MKYLPLGPRNSAEYKTSSGGRMEGAGGAERGGGGKGQGWQIFLRTERLSRRVAYEEIRKYEG